MATEVVVEHLGAVQFEVKARNHTIVCDQPEASGGFDEGMTPPELMLASLGTCAGYYAVQYLKNWKLPMDGLRLRVTAEKVKPPARLDEFRIEIDYLEVLDARHREGLVRAVNSCLIHNTLLHSPTIRVEVNSSQAAQAA
jgi:putative redox protein